MTKKLTWFDKWNRFFNKLSMEEQHSLYNVLCGLRGPDSDYSSENDRKKEWSRRLRDVLGFRMSNGCFWACVMDFSVLPELKGLEHYNTHVFSAFEKFDELGVIV